MDNTNLTLRLIYLLRKEKVSEAYRELKATGSYAPEAVVDYKNNKLDILCRHVQAGVPRYTGFGSPLPHSGLPIVDKDEFRKDINSFMTTGCVVSWRSTSGTTGSPFVFPKDRNATAYMDAMMYLAYGWHGILPGDRQARLWGRPLKKKDKILQYFKDLILKRKRLSAFEMNDDNCREFYRTLSMFKPKFFYAYSNALYQFATFLESDNLDGRLLDIKLAICTGEVLFSHQREKIAQVFGCRVVNEYGSTENGIIGFECEHGKMHVMPTVTLEIIDPDESGCGQIVVTELNSRSVPFLRYKNGDKGRLVKERCACNRPYEVMEIHEGRIDDYIKCPDGKLVYDAILAYTMKEYALQFKAFQDSLTCLRIHFMPNENYDKDAESRLKKTLAKYLGDQMKIDLLQVNDIPPEKSGKFRYFISNLNNDVDSAPVAPV